MEKFYPIGYVFQYESVRLKVVEKKNNPFCRKCYFRNLPSDVCFRKPCECSAIKRPDGKMTIFVQTTEPLTSTITMAKNVEQVYRSLLERKVQLDENDFDHIWDAVLDNLVLSNKSLALDIEDLANLEPDEFKKEALKLAKKEYSL